MLGGHNKVMFAREDAKLAIEGDVWQVVKTPVGRLGILLGEESLYPETGRVMAYQGADLLVTLAATGSEALAAYVRHGAIAAGAGESLLRHVELSCRQESAGPRREHGRRVYRPVRDLRTAGDDAATRVCWWRWAQVKRRR